MMIKLIGGRRAIQWGRTVIYTILVSALIEGLVLAAIDPVKLKALIDFLSCPGFVTVTTILTSFIGINSVVRSIFPKPGIKE
jgi:hypothetical protein